MNLYELTQNYLQVLEMAENGADGFEDTLDSLNDAIEVKAENTATVIKQLEANADMLANEIKRLSERRTTLENNAKRLKIYLQDQLEYCGKEKIKGPRFTVAIQNNPPSVRVTDESKLIGYLVEQPKKLDKKAIMTDLKAGREVSGAELQHSRSLRIR